DDLAEDRPHETVGERAAVRARQAREHALLATRRVHARVRARLLLGDRDRERGALVQQAEKVVVDPVDVPPERGNRGLARHAALGARSSARPALLQTYAGGRSVPKRRYRAWRRATSVPTGRRASSSRCRSSARPRRAAARAGSRCAPPPGSRTTSSTTFAAARSSAVRRSSAALRATVSGVSRRNRMEAQPSGEMTEYQACSCVRTRSATASAPPLPPSPISAHTTGTPRPASAVRLAAIASACPRSSAPMPG